VSGLASSVDLFKVSQSYAKKGAIRMVNNVCGSRAGEAGEIAWEISKLYAVQSRTES